MVEITSSVPLVLRHGFNSKALDTKTRLLKTFHLKKTEHQMVQKTKQKRNTTTVNLLDISTKPTLVKKVYLQNRNRYFVQIPGANATGKLRGVGSNTNQFSKSSS